MRDRLPRHRYEDPRAFGGPTASSWREQALTRVAELEILADAFTRPRARPEPEAEILRGLQRHLRDGSERGER